MPSDVPDHLTLRRNRDLEGKRELPWRRAGVAVVTLFIAVGLFNGFGQRPQTHLAAVPEASLKVYAPERVRAGLFYEARFTIHALQEIKDATLVFSTGWLEGITLNTIEPSPVGEASRDGRISPARTTRDPLAERKVKELDDGARRLFTIHRTITVFP